MKNLKQCWRTFWNVPIESLWMVFTSESNWESGNEVRPLLLGLSFPSPGLVGFSWWPSFLRKRIYGYNESVHWWCGCYGKLTTLAFILIFRYCAPVLGGFELIKIFLVKVMEYIWEKVGRLDFTVYRYSPGRCKQYYFPFVARRLKSLKIKSLLGKKRVILTRFRWKMLGNLLGSTVYFKSRPDVGKQGKRSLRAYRKD